MLLKTRVQEPYGDPGPDSGAVCLLLLRIGEVDHDRRHKVTSPWDSMSPADFVTQTLVHDRLPSKRSRERAT